MDSWEAYTVWGVGEGLGVGSGEGGAGGVICVEGGGPPPRMPSSLRIPRPSAWLNGVGGGERVPLSFGGLSCSIVLVVGICYGMSIWSGSRLSK